MVTGTFYFQFVAGNLTLNSQPFVVTAPVVSQDIISPLNGQLIIQNNSI
jgi:hypothetical protein